MVKMLCEDKLEQHAMEVSCCIALVGTFISTHVRCKSCPVHVFLCLYVCLSVCLSVCVCVSLSLSLSVNIHGKKTSLPHDLS